jgi:hypothetical protein
VTETLPTLPERERPERTGRTLLVIPRIHDGSGTRILYGLVATPGAARGKDTLEFPAGPVVDPGELRAGAALVLSRQIGDGMAAAVIAPLGRLHADGAAEQRVDVMLAVARRTDAEGGEALEPVGIPGMEWVDEQQLLQHLKTGRIADTSTAAAIALMLACGELVR